MTEEELRILAWTALGEAGGEGTAGMEAVLHVIRNRALSGRFPSNPASTALQANSSGIHQFSTWNALTQGGNIPRARYPVGSAAFTRAMNAVAKVFGPTPGKDPTQGATHYYAPQGMAGGKEPYWWRSEAPQGGKRIGNHIFALKRPEAVAPTPAQRSVTSDKGNFPSPGTLEVFRTGKPMRLPEIGPSGGPRLSKDAAPKPAKQSLALQLQRENAGATVVSSSTMIYDPVTRTLVKPMPTAREVIRAQQAEQQATRSDTVRPAAKTVQRVAGFSVPGGTAGIAEIDRARRIATLSSQTPSYAGQERGPARTVTARPNTQTTFAPPAQPAGSINPNKPEDRLPAAGALEPRMRVESGGLSRDAVAARAAGRAVGNVMAVAPPPMLVPRPQRPPVPVAVPRPPLEIVVQPSNPVAEVIREKPKTLYYTDPVAFGNAAVQQSGDNSSGSQAEAAAARASGDAWRASRNR